MSAVVVNGVVAGAVVDGEVNAGPGAVPRSPGGQPLPQVREGQKAQRHEHGAPVVQE